MSPPTGCPLRPLSAQPSSPPSHPGVPFGSRNVLADQAIREGVKKFTSWPTIPQVGSIGWGHV